MGIMLRSYIAGVSLKGRIEIFVQECRCTMAVEGTITEPALQHPTKPPEEEGFAARIQGLRVREEALNPGPKPENLSPKQ